MSEATREKVEEAKEQARKIVSSSRNMLKALGPMNLWMPLPEPPKEAAR